MPLIAMDWPIKYPVAMSTIVIVRKNNKAVIGSDSLFTTGGVLLSAEYKTNHHKIHQFGDSFIGFTGSSLIHNIFEDIIEKYPGNLDFSSRSHIFRTFLFLHAKIKEEYFVLTHETYEKGDQPVESSQLHCLIANSGGIFEVDSYRIVVEYEKFWASGSGRDISLGAMHAIYDILSDPEDIARAGLHAACTLDDASGLPVSIKTVTINK